VPENGSLAQVFSDALTFIECNTKTGWRKTEKGGREELRSYPKEAVREAVVNAIAHRDYSIQGTQIDIDIYDNRIDIVSPGSWLLPRPYEENLPSIRRNLQPMVIIYPGFLKLTLFDKLYRAPDTTLYHDEITASEKIIRILKTEGGKPVKELQEATFYKSRSQFLKEVINPLISSGVIYRDGNLKSPAVRIKLNCGIK